MTILTIRTDKPEAEIGLYQNETQLAYDTWHAHRELAETIHAKIADLCQGQSKNLNDIEGIVFFKGPGSFTGLRIGASVGNALAYGLGVPIVASSGDDWQAAGIARLLAGEQSTTALPEYGAPAFTTVQKK